jgi:hypothetical protein
MKGHKMNKKSLAALKRNLSSAPLHITSACGTLGVADLLIRRASPGYDIVRLPKLCGPSLLELGRV